VGVLKVKAWVNDPELTPTLTTNVCRPLTPYSNGPPLAALQNVLVWDIQRDASQAVIAGKLPASPVILHKALALASKPLKFFPRKCTEIVPVTGWFLETTALTAGTSRDENGFNNFESRIKKIDKETNELALPKEAVFESAHESEIHIVDTGEDNMIRDFTEVESNPYLDPKIESVDEPEVARFTGKSCDAE
jgi:hypothetical protein